MTVDLLHIIRDGEEYRNKKDKTGNESGNKNGGSNLPQFQKQKRRALSSTSAPVPRNKVEYHGQNL